MSNNQEEIESLMLKFLTKYPPLEWDIEQITRSEYEFTRRDLNCVSIKVSIIKIFYGDSFANSPHDDNLSTINSSLYATFELFGFQYNLPLSTGNLFRTAIRDYIQKKYNYLKEYLITETKDI